jgi:hypothetical protein
MNSTRDEQYPVMNSTRDEQSPAMNSTRDQLSSITPRTTRPGDEQCSAATVTDAKKP